MSSPLFVGVAGGTASGKSTVARKIHESLAGIPAALVDQDSYYKDLSDLSPAERKEVNFDHPDAFDVDLLLAHLRELVREGPVTLVYSAHDEVHNDAVVLRDVLLGQ